MFVFDLAFTYSDRETHTYARTHAQTNNIIRVFFCFNFMRVLFDRPKSINPAKIGSLITFQMESKQFVK